MILSCDIMKLVSQYCISLCLPEPLMAGSTYEFNSIAGSFLLLFSSSRLHMHLVGLENTTYVSIEIEIAI